MLQATDLCIILLLQKTLEPHMTLSTWNARAHFQVLTGRILIT